MMGRFVRVSPPAMAPMAAGGASLRGNRGAQVQRSVVSDNGGFDAPGFYYEKCLPATYKLDFYNNIGYLPDGTAMHLAGNALNHPETIGPDLHVPGSALPEASLMNSVGYLPDGTAMNLAGNALNHPETIGPDLHTPGSALPPPLFGFVNDVGYTPDGTDMTKAGNLLNHQ